MIKRTLYIGNPCFLLKKQNQLVVDYGDGVENKQVPIEDIGLMVVDHYQVKMTTALIQALIENNSAVLICDEKHLPAGMMLPMSQHHAFTEKMYYQLEASLPLKKNLWQQTIVAKIKNQAAMLESCGVDSEKMLYWARQVRSGDPDNYEGRAAAYYWDNLFTEVETFKRFRHGEPPNNLLNYGYAILRSIVARSLVASGMIPSVGIHHRNKYNPYCLADDIMEPYRPYVDGVVLAVMELEENIEELTPDIKKKLLAVASVDVNIGNQSSPLMVGMQRTTASLMKCFEGTAKKLLFPTIIV
ncbi:MAG: type II CRISPR-associated endonuclease Cas1 [Bacteroidales bacterium]|nr:type II CRISPR-associated endonuclease Cas1 [Bacteroidales bacterium]